MSAPALVPFHCICHAREMSQAELEEFAKAVGGPNAVPERDDDRHRFVVRLGGEEFFARFEVSA